VNGSIDSAELESFQATIARRLGLRFDDGKLTFLAEVLSRRAQERRLGTLGYLTALEQEADGSSEIGELARELTVGETYFFRHADQFRAFTEVALPERLSARAASRRLRLLSAGCASGEEAYSLAILLRERGIDAGFEIAIQGVDLNPGALERARNALYSAWSLRETSDELRERWFEREGRDHRLVQAVRDAVRFDQLNLTSSNPSLLVPRSFDIVFCRNVLMYFTPEHATRAVAQLAQALAPGGFLFLGHAETLRGLSHDFHLRHTHNTFYYQLKDDADPQRALELGATATSPVAPAAAPVSAEWVGTWLETVGRSSDRIRELSGRVDAKGATVGPTPAAAPRDLSQAFQLLRHERFAEALDLMHEPAPGDGTDSAALLLRAALFTQQGALAEAQQVCHELLRLDDLNAGAHYLLALCFERRGEAQQAIEHDRTAVYLDAGFAMPHLHLGLMARRRRDTEAARHELGKALLLLEREDESRLLLFGGGFSRGALLALCRSELSNLKGSA
jgi:chemotaxis protein methyltransferase CheR